MTNRYFISIDGICKDCKYPVICDSGVVAEDKDYHYIVLILIVKIIKEYQYMILN